ncbi:MAG: hypothetical protein JST93_15095 [Acidobacteria bacterium]|nr:hypothetical protein [Acidobacteriota bacterium]
MSNKFLGPIIAILLLAIETPVLIRTAIQAQQRDTRQPRPFSIKIFEPVINTPVPSGENLYHSDRVIEIDGHPILNRADFEEAMLAAEPRGSATVLVEHYPDDDEPWQETAIATFRRQPGSFLMDSLATTAWFSAVIWPAVCVLLAAAVLAVNSSSRRAWLAALVLTGAGHFSWVVTSPYVWSEPLRTLMVVYSAAIAAAGPIALFAAAIVWPGAQERPWHRWIWRTGIAWTAASVAVRLAEKSSYALLAPFTFFDSIFGSGTFLLVMIAGITTAIRWSGKHRQDQSPLHRSMATVLRRGVWAFQLSLGVLFIFLPRFLEFETVLQLKPIVWILYLACLGFPLSLAWVGAQRDGAPIEVAPLPQAGGWPELFAAARQTAHDSIGLQLLALYGPADDELRVQAAVPGAMHWAPIKPDAPPRSAVVQWVAFPQGFFALESAPIEDRQREALQQLANQVSEQAQHFTSRASPTQQAF